MFKLNITILCENIYHPINLSLRDWVNKNFDKYHIQYTHSVENCSGGDILFIISTSNIISRDLRDKYSKSLVIHAGDLPKNRGWSPHIWEILRGEVEITLTLLDAEDKVDSGAVYLKKKLTIANHLLWNEINDILFAAEIEMMDFFINNYGEINAVPQSEVSSPTYCKKRTPEDSRLDPKKSIEEQFNLIRVCDPQRYPAFFDFNGFRYKLVLEKINT